MAWDPAVLRKYSTTSHFRLLNQVRTELKSSPLSRSEDGRINLGMGRRSAPYRVVIDGRGSLAAGRAPRVGEPRIDDARDSGGSDPNQGEGGSFRDRLRAIEMR
ncbi:MAG: hypothetical protein ACK5QW_08355 [Cyanobacteriota bacterium]|jgi:hypothetical protein